MMMIATMLVRKLELLMLAMPLLLCIDLSIRTVLCDVFAACSVSNDTTAYGHFAAENCYCWYVANGDATS